jgi:cytoskeletal protein CcmA (bactofilin family)
MFSDKKEKQTEPSRGQNRINEGTNIKGDINSNGFFRIDGAIEGNVVTPNKVVLGKSGSINGTLTCENADIEGTFEGKLDVSGTLTLRSSANINGDAIVGKLAVEPGASFNATCTMKGNEKKESTPSIEKPHPFDRSLRVKKSTEALN